jgi:hypothetical protein
MSISTSIAERIAKSGRPGGRTAVRLVEPGGSYALWVFDGDAIELYYHDATRGAVVVQHSLSPANAVRIARFVMKWWARRMWYGWKLRVWEWAMRVRTEASADGEA